VGAIATRRGSGQGESEVEVEVGLGTRVGVGVGVENIVVAGTGTGAGVCLDSGDNVKSARDRVPLIGTGCCLSLDCTFPSALPAAGALRDLWCVGGSDSGSAFSGAEMMCF
jgi:hypothetical protein